MNRFIQSFKNKKFRYGAFSTITVLFVIAILIAVNLVFSQLDIKFDLTKDKMYSISEESKKILAGVTEDVTIYALFKTGDENLQFKSMLDEYAASSSHIEVIYRDPYIYPLFVEKYKMDDSEIAVNSVIVESAKRFKVINASDMVSYGFDYETYESYVSSIDIEPQITNAIKYVSDENTSVIYTLTGHQEVKLDESYIKQITLANYEMKDLDLFSTEVVPDDCAVLIVTTPMRDWTVEEAERVRQYLENDGRLMLFVDYTKIEYPNMFKVLNTYGVQLSDSMIFEGDTKQVFQNLPYRIIPLRVSHEITTPLASTYPNLVTQVRGIQTLDIVKKSITIEPLLTTTDMGYAKTNPTAQSVNKEDGDETGKFNIAVAITDSTHTDRQHITKLVVLGTTSILDPNLNEFYVGGSNSSFVLNAINWLHERDDTVYIRPKSPNDNSSLFIPMQMVIVIMAVSVVIIPAAILITGIVVWLRRRNR